MPGIFGDVVKDCSLSTFDSAPIIDHSRLMSKYGVTPIYSWCYNPFENDFTKPAANLTEWRELHRRIASDLKSNGLNGTIHELYNEPDLSWAFTGSWEEYLQMAVAAAQGIKAGDPDAVIIGPAAAIPSAGRLASVLQLVKSKQLPLSALSVHAYGAGAWQRNVGIAKAALASAGVDIPIHLNEVNVLSGSDPTAAVQLDGYGMAARVLSTVHELLEHEEVGMANWAQFLESGAGDKWGVVSQAGLLKPAFHAFYLYARMPSDRMKMTFTSVGALHGFTSANSSVVAGALWSLDKTGTDIGLVIEDLPFTGPVLLHIYIIDAAHNSGLTDKLLQPTSTVPLVPTADGRVSWEGRVQAQGVMYFEAVPQHQHH
jgi:hypothetical protein